MLKTNPKKFKSLFHHYISRRKMVLAAQIENMVLSLSLSKQMAMSFLMTFYIGRVWQPNCRTHFDFLTVFSIDQVRQPSFNEISLVVEPN